MSTNNLTLVEVIDRLKGGAQLFRSVNGKRYTMRKDDGIIGFVTGAVMVAAVGKSMIRGTSDAFGTVEYTLTEYGERYHAYVERIRNEQKDRRKRKLPETIEVHNDNADRVAETIERLAIATGD